MPTQFSTILKTKELLCFSRNKWKIKSIMTCNINELVVPVFEYSCMIIVYKQLVTVRVKQVMICLTHLLRMDVC